MTSITNHQHQPSEENNMDKYLLRTHYEGYIRVVLDPHHADLMALKLGQQPGKAGSYTAVHSWLQQQAETVDIDAPEPLRQFLRVRILAEIVQPDLLAKLREHVKRDENDEWPMQTCYLPGHLDKLNNPLE
jgi:hypothetical protein